VMSGAFGVSPVESVYVCELLALRVALPSAALGSATSTAAVESRAAIAMSPVIRLVIRAPICLALEDQRPNALLAGI
jgi:hypothetical protein